MSESIKFIHLKTKITDYLGIKKQNYFKKFNFLMNKIEDRKEFWIHSLQILNEVYICKYILIINYIISKSFIASLK